MLQNKQQIRWNLHYWKYIHLFTSCSGLLVGELQRTWGNGGCWWRLFTNASFLCPSAFRWGNRTSRWAYLYVNFVFLPIFPWVWDSRIPFSMNQTKMKYLELISHGHVLHSLWQEDLAGDFFSTLNSTTKQFPVPTLHPSSGVTLHKVASILWQNGTLFH